MHLPPLLVVSTLLFTPIYCKERPPHDQISIGKLSIEKGEPIGTLAIAPESQLDIGGTGCSDDSVATVFSPDKTLLTLIFNDFTATIEPGSKREQRRKFCAVNLAFKVPANWTFEVEKLNWRGYVDLDKGIRGVLKSTYFWRGERERDERASVRKVVEGPVHTDLTHTKDGERDKSVWLPCTRKQSVLHVNTVVRLCYDGECNAQGRDGSQKSGPNAKGVARTGKGAITVDSLDAKFKQTLQLGWKRC